MDSKRPTAKIAIVGAGVSGLSAAFLLKQRRPDLKIELFEAEDHVGGRMLTQRISLPLQADSACQFLILEDDQVRGFVFELAPKDSLRTLPMPILCLPEGWVVDPGSHYYITDGMGTWCDNVTRKLKRKPGFKLHLKSPVKDLSELQKAGFDAIFVTAPGPAAKALGSESSVEYQPTLSLHFMWHRAPKIALQHYAFRDVGERKGLGWLAHEGLKHKQPGLWTAQVSGEVALEWQKSAGDAQAMEDLLQGDLRDWHPRFAEGEITFVASKFWENGFPLRLDEIPSSQGFELRDIKNPQTGKKVHVFYLGDGYRGIGRVENAVQSALSACAAYLGES